MNREGLRSAPTKELSPPLHKLVNNLVSCLFEFQGREMPAGGAVARVLIGIHQLRYFSLD